MLKILFEWVLELFIYIDKYCQNIFSYYHHQAHFNWISYTFYLQYPVILKSDTLLLDVTNNLAHVTAKDILTLELFSDFNPKVDNVVLRSSYSVSPLNHIFKSLEMSWRRPFNVNLIVFGYLLLSGLKNMFVSGNGLKNNR